MVTGTLRKPSVRFYSEMVEMTELEISKQFVTEHKYDDLKQQSLRRTTYIMIVTK